MVAGGGEAPLRPTPLCSMTPTDDQMGIACRCATYEVRRAIHTKIKPMITLAAQISAGVPFR